MNASGPDRLARGSTRARPGPNPHVPGSNSHVSGSNPHVPGQPIITRPKPSKTFHTPSPSGPRAGSSDNTRDEPSHAIRSVGVRALFRVEGPVYPDWLLSETGAWQHGLVTRDSYSPPASRAQGMIGHPATSSSHTCWGLQLNKTTALPDQRGDGPNAPDDRPVDTSASYGHWCQLDRGGLCDLAAGGVRFGDPAAGHPQLAADSP
jgi:hypothetical protein